MLRALRLVFWVWLTCALYDCTRQPAPQIAAPTCWARVTGDGNVTYSADPACALPPDDPAPHQLPRGIQW